MDGVACMELPPRCFLRTLLSGHLMCTARLTSKSQILCGIAIVPLRRKPPLCSKMKLKCSAHPVKIKLHLNSEFINQVKKPHSKFNPADWDALLNAHIAAISSSTKSIRMIKNSHKFLAQVQQASKIHHAPQAEQQYANHTSIAEQHQSPVRLLSIAGQRFCKTDL